MIMAANIFWFTGLSGSGKTTVALGVKDKLEHGGHSVLILDGDDVRRIHHRHLGFTDKDIRENNSLIVKMCSDNRNKFDVILVPIISPFISSRQHARETLSPGFYEIYCSASLECVLKRDVKGLYSKAKNNELSNLIGFPNGPAYEIPDNPDLVVNSGEDDPKDSISSLYGFIESKLNT